MSTANGGSLDDCITNLFALTELSGLQWRQYESPSGTPDANPRTLLQTEPILVAYSKLQTEGILSVWRRSPPKVIPPVFTLLPTLQANAPKELWVFWYGSTEPEEIEKHCKDLVKFKNEDDPEPDATVNAIPYDVRCLLYKAWNTQMEKHYRSKKFVQIGRWFFRPHKFLDPNYAFTIDDFAPAHSHSFNIVGGNSMCMAVKVQMQPNLVSLAPFHIERSRKFRDEKVNVLLAPWSINGEISLRYAITPQTKKDEEEVDKQLAQWKEVNMFVDVKKKKKRRRDEGETEVDESDDETWGKMKMPKMIRVEVDGGVRMWWPTQYILVTLEETRRLVRSRFPVADDLKCVPEKEPMFAKNRFTNLTSSETSLRISQSVVDDGNLRKWRTRAANGTNGDLTVYSKRRLSTDLSSKKNKKKEKLSYEERTRRKLGNEAGGGSVRVRVSSVSDDEMEDEEAKNEEKQGMKRELKKMMKSHRYNWRGKNGRALTKKDTELKCFCSSSSDADEDERVEEGERAERQRKEGSAEGTERIAREITVNADHSTYHFIRSNGKRRQKSNVMADEERMARSPFTPVRVLSPIDRSVDEFQMATDMLTILGNSQPTTVEISEAKAAMKNNCEFFYDLDAAGTPSNLQYKKYHSRRTGDRLPQNSEQMAAQKKEREAKGKSMVDEIFNQECSSDDGRGTHKCRRPRQISPDPVKPVRNHVIPHFDMMQVGGVNVPPVMEIKPDKVIREKSCIAMFRPIRSNSIEIPELEISEEFSELDFLKGLGNPEYDLGSDEEPSDDRYSVGSSDLQQPLSAAAADDAGEGTSSGAENWRDNDDVEMIDDYPHMDSSGEIMDCMPPNSDSVLSPPASNERADSNNSMYHRLPGGPHSVGDSGALNKIYPTPPSLLQVDICSPAPPMGGPHSQATKDERDEEISSTDEEGLGKYLNEIDDIEEGEMRGTRGDKRISHLHNGLFNRKFFDNAPMADALVSHRFGSLQNRLKVPGKMDAPFYSKKTGEKKEQIQSHHVEVMAGIDNFANKKNLATAAATSTTGGHPWQQPLPHPSMAAHHQMQQMQHHQSQPGPSMTPLQPPLGPMQGHPAYMGQGQMYPGQPGGMRGQYPNAVGGVQQHPMQQPGFPPQQQQPPQYMAGGQMMMHPGPGQPGYHPGAVQMRPPGYPGYPPGAVPQMGPVHPSMQTPGMPMTYPHAMQNQMMYHRQGMAQGSYPPPQYNNQMAMMGGPNAMGGMQMGQYPGQMQQPNMMMQQPMQHGQPMIAGAPHPMGMPGMASHSPFPMNAASAAAVPSPATASVVSVGNQQRNAGLSPGKRAVRAIPTCPIDDELALVATRRGEDPYVNSLAIAPKKLLFKGTTQLKNEFELYTTERILDKMQKRGERSFGAPAGGAEGLSIVAAVMLQDTILNLHFDWVFDSCPLCACTTSIRSRELGLYIKPHEVLEESVEVQNDWVGPWNGFHSESADTTCSCGFSVIRHRLLSMRAGLFLEDSIEATGEETSGTTPIDGSRSLAYLWFDPSSPIDKALVETLRSIALTTDLGRFVSAIKNISNRTEISKKKEEETIPSVGEIGSRGVEYVISEMDKTELTLMGNSALYASLTTGSLSGASRGREKRQQAYFHPWGLQIASEMADPTEMEVKNLLEDVKPLIEGAVREARKLSSSVTTSVIEGPLTWRSLAAKNVKSTGNGDDDSHIAEPIPLIEMSTEKEAIRVAPTVMKNWEQFNLGPIDVPKDVLYLAVVPDDDRVYDMTVVYLRRLSKMYELNLRLGRHVGYLAKDDPPKSIVREGIIRAGSNRPHNSASPSLAFMRNIEKFAASVGCSREFIRKLTSYAQCLEDVIFEHLATNRIYERETFRECVGYSMWHRRAHQKQKNNSSSVARHERDTDEGSPPAGDEEERRGDEGEKRKESQMFRGPLAEAMGMTAGSAKGKKKARRPFGQSPPYGLDGETRVKPPDEEPGALPQTVVIYLTLWPCWGSEGRDGEAARVATIAIVKAFNAAIHRLRPKQRGLCQLELIPVQRLEEAVGCGADLDRLDRSSNLNTWQIGNMNRNGEVYPTDRPRFEDILKEIALGVYRKPRFLHCDALKSSLPKSMTKFGPASATLDWIDKNDGKKKTIYRCSSVPFQLANTPAIVAKNEAKYSQLCMDEVSLYISYCLVATDFIVVTLTDNLGARNESAVLNLKPKSTETATKFRSHNKTSVRDGLDRLWKFIEGAMLNESKPLRLVIGKLGKMGHGEFKAWCHVLSRSNLKKYSTRVRESCHPCNANAGAPTLLSACLVSTEPEAHLQVLPSYSIPADASTGVPKKIRPLHTPGDNTITHIMVFPVSSTIMLSQSTEREVDDADDDFGNLDVGGLGGDDMNEIMNELMTGDGEDGERPSARNQHMNSFFDGALESQMQNQPLAAGWMISTAPGGDLPDWFWSSCPSLKRRLPVHLRSSLHLNESQLLRSDDIMKKEKEQEISHALDSTKTDEVLRHVLEQYNDLSWLALDAITQERKSCLPIHIQALTRLHDTVLNLIM